MRNCCVRACVYTCVNAWMCVYYMLWFWERSFTVFVLCCFIVFVQWALTPLWCNRLSACLFWKASISHGTTNLSYLTFISFCSFFAISWTVHQWVALLPMTQGTELLELHALCKGSGQSHKDHLLGGRWFCDRKFDKSSNSFLTWSNQSSDYPKAQFTLQKPFHLCLVHYWNKLSNFSTCEV